MLGTNHSRLQGELPSARQCLVPLMLRDTTETLHYVWRLITGALYIQSQAALNTHQACNRRYIVNGRGRKDGGDAHSIHTYIHACIQPTNTKPRKGVQLHVTRQTCSGCPDGAWSGLERT